MGRQVRIVATPQDMGMLFSEVRRRGGSVAELWHSFPDPVVVEHPAALTGVLIPPPDLLVLDRHFREGTWRTREMSSQVVTFSAGHGPEGRPRLTPPGRLWFSTVLGYDEEETPVHPDPAFVHWCQGLFDWVRQTWSARDGVLFGPEALASFRPRPVVSWVLARAAELSHLESALVLAAWRRELDLPESELRVRVADHGSYVEASIHVRTVSLPAG